MSAVVLDMDHLSLVLQQRQIPLLDRLDQIPPNDVATTIVSFQEQIQGWLAYLKTARGDDQILRSYAELDGLLRWFSKMNVRQGAQLSLRFLTEMPGAHLLFMQRTYPPRLK